MAITCLGMGRVLSALISYGIFCLQDSVCPDLSKGLSKGRGWACLSVTPGSMDTEPKV